MEVVEKDAFGEITKTEKITAYRMGYGTDKYHCLNATIELKHKQTGELTIYGDMGKGYNLYSDVINLDDYECTRIKGYVYFIEYPEEVFTEVLNPYDRWSTYSSNASIQVTSSSMEGTWNVDLDAKVVENASGSWGDYFE